MSDFRLLIYLVVGFRLTMVIVYQPYILEATIGDGGQWLERGLTALGDFRYYFQVTQWVADGFWPYRDFWYEFPPVPIVVFTAVHQVTELAGDTDYMAWATLLGLLFTGVDLVNLWLVRRLGDELHGQGVGVALSWVYAVLAAPLVVPWWTFEPLVALAMLLAYHWLRQGRMCRSAMAVVVGTLTKYLSVLLLPAVWKFYPWRQAMTYTLFTVVWVGLVFGGLLAWGGEMAQASFTAQAQKASYQSIWALIDGNFGTGRFGEPEAHFDVDSASLPVGNDAVIPWWLRSLPFFGVGLFIFTRRLYPSDRHKLAFLTLTVVLFMLWAQGWSPQWVLVLIPLLLLNFPDRNGVLVALVLSFASFVEYPGLFMRTAESGGAISGNLMPTFVVLVLFRTAILIGIAGGLVRLLVSEGPYENAGH